MPQAYNFFREVCKSALSIPLFLCIWVSIILRCQNTSKGVTTLKKAQNLVTFPIIQSPLCPLPPLCNLPSVPSLTSNAFKKATKLLFSGPFEILLPGICNRFCSNKPIKIFYRFVLWSVHV